MKKVKLVVISNTAKIRITSNGDTLEVTVADNSHVEPKEITIDMERLK